MRRTFVLTTSLKVSDTLTKDPSFHISWFNRAVVVEDISITGDGDLDEMYCSLVDFTVAC